MNHLLWGEALPGCGRYAGAVIMRSDEGGRNNAANVQSAEQLVKKGRALLDDPVAEPYLGSAA
jgi:hypothetical protein